MPTSANPPLAAGTRLESYRIERMLAAGGFSFVYLAHDEQGEPVAIKEYRIAEDDPLKFSHGMRAFFEEGRALARLSHANVVRVLNFFRANGTVYLVMRYERGCTLREHAARHGGALEERWLRATFDRLLNGLREVHAHGLLHLDIKPANLYLRDDGTPLLLDFGAARQALVSQSSKLAPTYTPGFEAPELHAGQGLGPWTDIYGVGATLRALMPEPQAYSADLRAIVDACLRPDPLARPQSVLALQKALRGQSAAELTA